MDGSRVPEALAFWTTAPGHGEIRAESLSPPGPGEVLVRALYSGISRGTESMIFQGSVPPSEYERMRAPFQVGTLPAPVKYGYASVGEVEAGPRDLQGRRVFVLYPHQTRYVVPVGAVHVLPDDVPADRAILAANLETAVNGIWDGCPRPGDRIAVIGAGTVGCLVAWLAARIPGTEVELIDTNPRRASVAAALGARFAQPESASPDADVVFHASGAPSGLALALRIGAFESLVVELSWFGNRSVPLALGESFHVKRLSLVSSQVGVVAAAQRARWSTDRRLRLALTLAADPALDVLITGESEFDALPAVMASLAASPGEVICHRIRYAHQPQE